MGNIDVVTNPEIRAMLLEMSIFITVLTPIIIAVVEAIKRTFTHINPNYFTFITIVVAIALAFLGYIFTDLPAVYRLWAGVFAGLSAAKLYDIGKNIVNSEKKG